MREIMKINDDLDICYRSDLRTVENNLLEHNKRIEKSILETNNVISQVSKQMFDTNKNLMATIEALKQQLESKDAQIEKDILALTKVRNMIKEFETVKQEWKNFQVKTDSLTKCISAVYVAGDTNNSMVGINCKLYVKGDIKAEGQIKGK